MSVNVCVCVFVSVCLCVFMCVSLCVCVCVWTFSTVSLRISHLLEPHIQLCTVKITMWKKENQLDGCKLCLYINYVQLLNIKINNSNRQSVN